MDDRMIARIRRDLDQGALGRALERTYELCLAEQSDDVARWSRLELEGYFNSNPAMGDDITLPDYRTVPGEYSDLYGRLFLPPGNCGFINETRLRFGVAELERLSETRDHISFQDPGMIEMIREHLEVDVRMFRFNVVHLRSVFAAIRLELLTRLTSIAANRDPTPILYRREDVLMLQPNFQGIGINLRVLWRRVRRID